MRRRLGEALGRVRDTAEIRRHFVLPQTSRRMLVLAGLATAVVVFLAVLAAGPRPFHPGRDAELRATYDTYLDTGVLLIKPFGRGSPGTQWPTPTGFTYAAFDDDLGIYAVASLVGGAAGFDDPYRAIAPVQATVAAIPWLLLPVLMAKLFLRAAAGYVAIAALPIYALVAGEWAIVGTDYGREVLGWHVYALYGIAGSLVFFGLVIALALAISGRTMASTLGFAALLGVTAAAANMTRAVSGLAILLATAVALLIRESRWRPFAALAVPVLLAFALPAVAMTSINAERTELTGLSADEVPAAHPVWHVTYLGLGYLGYGSNYEEPNPFGVRWSDEFAYQKAREVDPDIQLASDEYEEILRDLFVEGVQAHPILAVKGYLLKALDVVAQNGAVLAVIAAVAILASRAGMRAPFLLTGLISAPVTLLGIAPPTAVMPFRYFFVELTAGLSLLFVVAVPQTEVLYRRLREERSPTPTAP